MRRKNGAYPASLQHNVRKRFLYGSVGLVLLSSCSDGRDITWPQSRITRDQLIGAMTPEGARAIGPDDRLQLAPPPNTGRPQISSQQAGKLAVSLAKHFLPYTHSFWDNQRGRTIDYQKLVVCNTPVYAASPFERLEMDDPTTQAHYLQKGLGPLWLVSLCGPNGPPQMNIAVSSYSTDLRLDIDGIIEFPAIGGGDFFPEAVPIAQELEELPSAEEAVLLAASATGRRVASAPELIAPFYREGNPFGSRWRITLDGPVRLRAASGEVIESTQIFIRRLRPINGQSAQVWSAPLAQPDGVDVVYVPQARVGENYNDYLARREAETRTIRVSRLPDMPISFVAGGITP